MRRIVVVALLSALPGLSLAQTVEFAVAHPALQGGYSRAEVAFADVPSGDGSAGFRLAIGEEMELGLRVREAGSLATVGNLITTLAADASTGGRYAAAFTARGVLGPAAVRVRASVHDGLPALAPLAEGEFGELPLLGAGPAVFGLEAGVTYRVSRSLIVGSAPGLFLRGGRLGARLDGEARLVRFHDRNDLLLLLATFAEPGFDRSTIALGAGYTINRRRAPSWTPSLWLGLGPGGIAPGATLRGAERLPNGRLELLLAAQPYRIDAWPYRLDLSYEQDLGGGELIVGLVVGLQPQAGWRTGGRVAYRLPFER